MIWFVCINIKFWFSTHILFFTYTVRKVSWFPIAKRLTNLRGKRYHSFIMTLKSCFSVACTLSLNIENGYANMEGHSEPLGMESNTVSDRVPLTQVIAEVCFFFLNWLICPLLFLILKKYCTITILDWRLAILDLTRILCYRLPSLQPPGQCLCGQLVFF